MLRDGRLDVVPIIIFIIKHTAQTHCNASVGEFAATEDYPAAMEGRDIIAHFRLVVRYLLRLANGDSGGCRFRAAKKYHSYCLTRRYVHLTMRSHGLFDSVVLAIMGAGEKCSLTVQ